MKFSANYVAPVLVVGVLIFAAWQPALASTGTIDATNHYAWSDNGVWVNWSPSNGNVTVTDTELTGYIWSADFGWINLSPTNGGVMNDGSGNLGGWAWGQSTGWIDFSGVTVDASGVFHGTTVTQSIFGTMNFDCTNCKVVTSWRKTSGTNTNVTTKPRRQWTDRRIAWPTAESEYGTGKLDFIREYAPSNAHSYVAPAQDAAVLQAAEQFETYSSHYLD